MAGLQEKFVKCYEGEIVSSSEIANWYESNKSGASFAYRPAVHTIIIEPLMRRGFLERISRGLYRVGYWPEEAREIVIRPAQSQAQSPQPGGYTECIRPVKPMSKEEVEYEEERFAYKVMNAGEDAKAVVRLYLGESWVKEARDSYKDLESYCAESYSTLREAAEMLTSKEAEELGIDFYKLQDKLGCFAKTQALNPQLMTDDERIKKAREAAEALTEEQKESFTQQQEAELKKYIEEGGYPSRNDVRDTPPGGLVFNKDFFEMSRMPKPPQREEHKSLYEYDLANEAWWNDILTSEQRVVYLEVGTAGLDAALKKQKVLKQRPDADVVEQKVQNELKKRGRKSRAEREAIEEERVSLGLGLKFTSKKGEEDE